MSQDGIMAIRAFSFVTNARSTIWELLFQGQNVCFWWGKREHIAMFYPKNKQCENGQQKNENVKNK